jgi:hypothetical protein
MSQLILGIGNKARHGKDSFAKAIELYYGKINATALKHSMSLKPIIVQQHAFADALYKEVNAQLKHGDSIWKTRCVYAGNDDGFTFSYAELPEWVQPDPNPEVSERSPYGKHPKLLQWWGTEFRRARDPNYWVDKFVAGINPKADIVIATDMRFLNEADMIKKLGGYTVQVNRLNADGTPFVDTARPANHVSEIQLDGYNYDYKITVKTGDLPLLEEWAITLVSFLRGWKGKR